jgi:hypothetical protein
VFAVGNYIEAVLWCVIALGFGVQAIRKSGAIRTRCAQAAILFLLFGLSDVVEVQTGAWWRPWWLLLWKGGCVIGLGLLLIDRVRRRT